MSVRRQEVEELWTDGIQVLPGRRPINFDVVDQLAQSMDRIGLRHPITVRAINDIAVHLVAGHHRLEAAKKLGWEKIACVVLEAADCSEVEAELWEIAENLHRADLTKKQRNEQIRRYAHLIAIRDADLQSRQNDGIESKRVDKRGHRREGPASKVAKETGVSVRTVQRALAEAKPLPHKQPAAPVQHVEPSQLQGEHDTSGMWRSRLRELMAEIDVHLERAPSPPDLAYGLKRLDGKWLALPAHNDDGEIIDDITNCEEGQDGFGSASAPASSQPEPPPQLGAAPRPAPPRDATQRNDLPDPVVAGQGKTTSNPADPLAGQGLHAAPRSASGPDLSELGAQPEPSSATGADEEPVAGEILTASGASMPGLPSFLDRRGRS